MAGRATDLPDIGTTLQAKIVELTETGDIAALAKLRERIPPGLAAVARLDGIGPKRAAALFSRAGGHRRGRPRRGAGGRAPAGGAGVRPRHRGAGGGAARPARGGGGRRRGGARAGGPGPAPGRGGGRGPPGRRAGRPRGGGRQPAPGPRDGRTTSTWWRRADRPAEVQDALAALPAVQRVLSRGEAGDVGGDPRGRAGGAGGGAARRRSATCCSTPPDRPRTTCACASWRCAGGSPCPSTASPGREARLPCTPTRTSVYAALGLHPIPPELREDRGEIEAAQAGPLPALVTPRRPAGRPARPHALERRHARPSPRWSRPPGRAATPTWRSATTPRASPWPAGSTPTACGASGRRSTPRTRAATTSGC